MMNNFNQYNSKISLKKFGLITKIIVEFHMEAPIWVRVRGQSVHKKMK